MGERVRRRGREALHTGQIGAQAAPHLREGKRLRESVARRRIRGGARQQAVRLCLRLRGNYSWCQY